MMPAKRNRIRFQLPVWATSQPAVTGNKRRTHIAEHVHRAEDGGDMPAAKTDRHRIAADTTKRGTERTQGNQRDAVIHVCTKYEATISSEQRPMPTTAIPCRLNRELPVRCSSQSEKKAAGQAADARRRYRRPW